MKVTPRISLCLQLETPKPSTSQENEYMPETPLAIPLSGTPLIPLQKPTLSKRKLTMPVSATASAKKSTAQPPKNFKEIPKEEEV